MRADVVIWRFGINYRCSDGGYPEVPNDTFFTGPGAEAQARAALAAEVEEQRTQQAETRARRKGESAAEEDDSGFEERIVSDVAGREISVLFTNDLLARPLLYARREVASFRP